MQLQYSIYVGRCLNVSYLTSFFIYFSLLLQVQYLKGQWSEALPYAHAHNDYAKCFRRPAFRAISYGCTSIEIDIFHYKDKLKIAHVPLFLSLRKEFESTYLKPLHDYYLSKGHYFKSKDQKLILMLDFKRSAGSIYYILRPVLDKYKGVLSYYDHGNWIDGPIQILISGAKPYQEVFADSIQFMFLDGNPSDLDKEGFSATIFPRISCSYRSLVSGKLDDAEMLAIKQLSQKVQDKGSSLRFWAVPNRINLWKKLRELGVDWLQVDQLDKLKKFKKIKSSE